MTAIESAAQAFIQSPEEIERLNMNYFRAEMLSDSGQVKFKGRAIFEFDTPGRGLFEIEINQLRGESINKITALRDVGSGQEFEVSACELCPAGTGPHLHFNFKSKEELAA